MSCMLLNLLLQRDHTSKATDKVSNAVDLCRVKLSWQTSLLIRSPALSLTPLLEG